MRLSLKEIAEFTNGELFNCDEKEIVTSVTTDTREVSENSLFVALKGEKFDGHSYAEKAIEGGAAAVLSEKDEEFFNKKIPIIKVKSTYDALLDLACGYRKKLDVKIVAVTGSVGKTTTKDMVAAVISQEMQTVKTKGNLNNHIGMPKTLFSIGEEDRCAVVEMGMNHFGEISRLTNSALPDLAVITCIGVSHIENLGSRENILKAKLEILEGMEENAPVIINADDDMLSKADFKNHRVIRCSLKDEEAELNARNITVGTEGCRFDIYSGNRYLINVFLPAVGVHNVQNALLAAAVGLEMGVEPFQISAGLSSYVPSGMRQKITKKAGMTFIEDCYNASPTSMIASLSVLESISSGSRKVAVLGDMLELGEIAGSSHREVGVKAGEVCDEVICCGDLAKEIHGAVSSDTCHSVFFETREETIDYLIKTLKKGDFVLFKASHSMQFEKIIEAVYTALDENK